MQIWYDVDTALSEVPVNIMSLIDDTDFKSRETGVAYNAAGMDLRWNFVTTAGAFTSTAVTPTTAGVYDWTDQGDGIYTIEIPASGGASINNDTEGFGWFTGIITGILPWRGPICGFRAAAINNALIDGGDELDVNVTKVSDTAQTGNDNGADINAILLDTAEIGSAGAGLTSIPWNASWDAEVQSEVADGLTAYDAATGADIEALNDPTAVAIADQVWDEPKAGHVGAGSFGEEVQAHSLSTEISALNDPTAVAIRTEMDSNSSQLAAIVADTNELQGDWVNGGRLDLILDIIAADTTTDIPALIAALNDPTAAAIRTEMDSNSTQLAAIVADTNELQTDDVPGLIAALNDLSAAQVNAEVLDVLNTDTFAEPTGVPGATITLAAKIGFLYMALRNQVTVTATKKTFFDDGGTGEWEKDLSDDGTTYTETEANAI